MGRRSRTRSRGVRLLALAFMVSVVWSATGAWAQTGPSGPTGPDPTGPTGPGPTGPTGPDPTGPTGPDPTGPTGPGPTGPTGPGPTGPTGPAPTGPGPNPPPPSPSPSPVPMPSYSPPPGGPGPGGGGGSGGPGGGSVGPGGGGPQDPATLGDAFDLFLPPYAVSVDAAGARSAAAPSGTGGRGIHLRPQSLPEAAAEVVALAAGSTSDEAASSGSMPRNLALLSLLAAVALAVLAAREWRGGPRGRYGTPVLEQLRERWASLRRSRA